MAAAATASQIFESHQSDNNNNSNNEVSRQEIQAAIAKAVELRALHAALMQGNSPAPANLRYPSSASPVSRPVSQFSAQDYPVFTPSYEDETLSGYHTNNQALSESWDEYGLEAGNGTETVLSDYKKEISASRKGFSPALAALESHICSAEDQKSVIGSCANHITVLQTSPGAELYKSCRSRRNSLGDFKSVSSCNRCKPAVITTESENVIRNIKNSNTVVPLTDSHSSVQSQPKNRGVMSWFFPRLKKKQKNENSPNRTESEEVSQIFKDFGMLSIETLKRELIEANENRDAALMEVAEMRSSLGELKQKLEYLETYCEELKKALRQATQTKDSQINEKLGNFPRRGKSIDGNGENLMPVSEEVMVEGFLQIVSEARLSVKQFCKTLVGQIEQTDNTLMDNLNLLLQPYKLSLNSKYSKAVLYHLEALINQSLYQDFENCVFQKNGSPKHLDPQQDRQAQFTSYVALRNLSWNEVLRKGTKYYSEEFSKFCDQKMSLIITTLNWTRPWPEQLLQAFFVAAKCIWLLHLLAFSFNPPLGILRVEENRTFDPHYMEDMFMERQRPHGPSRVKIMVMPGFYVQARVLRCKVICRYKFVA
ncbi:DNA double-strand break repair rad50 ATPase [Theobroma cacao]|uniref:DNA double-strand break repair rad50 ATPase n=1 Tax=Theobroma cacao TaxID=3641 RepID=A0A061GZ54_THECC|nr:DNA double-strand break repair rad50 ATPase [Theobroma cacao]